MKAIRVGNRQLKLQIWDTAGQERFRSLIPSYIKDCCISIIVYDVTSSFALTQTGPVLKMPMFGSTTSEKVEAKTSSLLSWETRLTWLTNGTLACLIRVVTTNEGMEKAQHHNVMFIETSSRTRQGIMTLFDNLIRAITGDEENEGAGTANPSGNADPSRLVCD